MKVSSSQIFRRNTKNLNCERHFKIFNNYKVIPEYCFGCFKVSFEVGTVIDLIKLYIVFDNIEMPNNNIRKCMIEERKEISGSYKGFMKKIGPGKPRKPFSRTSNSGWFF